MSIVKLWRAAATRTFVKVQLVCLVVIVCAGRLVEGLYSMRYENHFDCWPHSYMIPFEVLEGFALTVIPAIIFSAIVPIVLIKRIRMQWPMWIDHVIVETGMLIIIAVIVAIVLMILEPTFLLSKALRVIGFISIVVLPIGGLGVLSCQRVFKKYMKVILPEKIEELDERKER